jgi:hypothetical protein
MPTTMSDREIHQLYADARRDYLSQFKGDELRIKKAELLANGLPLQVLENVRAKISCPAFARSSGLPTQLVAI